MASCEFKPGKECANQAIHPFIESLILNANPEEELPEGNHPCLHDLLAVPSIKALVDVEVILKGCWEYTPQQRSKELVLPTFHTAPGFRRF